MRKYSVLLPLAVMAFLPLGSIAAEKVVAQTTPDLSLRVEVENSIGKGLTWLAGKQNPEGYWAQSEHPAVTALILTAFQGDPSKFYQKKYQKNIKAGYDYLATNVKPDGSIYSKGLPNYNTAISMTAFMVANNKAYEPILKNARKYLISQQDDFGEKGMGDHPLDGGVGYGGRGAKNSDINVYELALLATGAALYPAKVTE